jgi:hypothetical protein
LLSPSAGPPVSDASFSVVFGAGLSAGLGVSCAFSDAGFSPVSNVCTVFGTGFSTGFGVSGPGFSTGFSPVSCVSTVVGGGFSTGLGTSGAFSGPAFSPVSSFSTVSGAGFSTVSVAGLPVVCCSSVSGVSGAGFSADSGPGLEALSYPCLRGGLDDAGVNFNFLLGRPLGGITEDFRFFADRGGETRMGKCVTAAFFLVSFFPWAFFKVASSGNTEVDLAVVAFCFAACFTAFASAFFKTFSFAAFTTLAAQASSAPALGLAIMVAAFLTKLRSNQV